MLQGDQVRLTQVVSNLIHKRGALHRPRRPHRGLLRPRRQEAVLRVADNGRGIAPQMLDRIFDIFVQEREGGGGLGLGLTLVHRLVQLHGGVVRAYSEGTGRGSEFVVRLPLVENVQALQPVVAAEVPEDSGDPRAAPPLRIVVVEDQDDVRDAMQALLEGWGTASSRRPTAPAASS